MEIRIQRIFLKTLLASFLTAISLTLCASDIEDDSVNNVKVFDPQVERPEIDKDAIDTENWELGVNYGVISIEDFGSSSMMSYNVAYHVSEDFFLSLNYGETTVGLSSFESLTGITWLGESRDYKHYSVALGVNLLPGEGFIGKDMAFTSNFYFLAGLGSTEFAGDNRSTIVVGAGYQVLFNDWLAMNISARNNIYDNDITGSSKVVNDLEFSTGFTVFF